MHFEFKKGQQRDITDRTFNFAVRIVNLCKVLDETPGVGRVLYKQLIRSGTSIGANVEESQSAQSKADFVHKLEISLKEARETRYWLRILITTQIIKESQLSSLLKESEELIKIIAAIIVKTKQNNSK
ncbi:MAG: four helix bundle protein (plasmid) [Nodularia sp. CChRGM 3473]